MISNWNIYLPPWFHWILAWFLIARIHHCRGIHLWLTNNKGRCIQIPTHSHILHCYFDCSMIWQRKDDIFWYLNEKTKLHKFHVSYNTQLDNPLHSPPENDLSIQGRWSLGGRGAIAPPVFRKICKFFLKIVSKYGQLQYIAPPDFEFSIHCPPWFWELLPGLYCILLWLPWLQHIVLYLKNVSVFLIFQN